MTNKFPPIFSQKNCRRFSIAPAINNSGITKVLISKDTRSDILSLINFSLGHYPQYEISSEEEIQKQIDTIYKSNINQNENQSAEEMPSSSVINLVDEIITEAIELGASDVHIEPFENSYLVRYRLDGVLQEKTSLDKNLVSPVVSRIKILSGLDIAEKRRPQDGRIRFSKGDNVVDIRVSVLPTDFGEKTVLRILDKSTLRLDLSLLGMRKDDLDIFKQKISLPYGIIMITGPTGSGKTTTLYAALNHIKSPGINITTIEDPIEYNLEGINQTQIRPEINLTFASALRSILRQDPNVIMVGEIRDKETLENALRASLTGHLVLSTLHTNDSFSTVARLKDLGADTSILKSSLKLIVAQRLVRKICPHCKTNDTPENEQAAASVLGIPIDKIKYGRGCEHCMGIGYWGRTSVFEILPIDAENARRIFEAGSSSAGLEIAGNRDSLRKSGIKLIESGTTTPSEVLRETE